MIEQLRASVSDIISVDSEIIVEKSQSHYDGYWRLAYRDANDLINDGNDFFELPVVSIGSIVAATPEGDKINTYNLTASDSMVKLGRIGGALQFTDEEIRFRRIGSAIAKLDAFTSGIESELARIHYEIFNTADRTAAVVSVNLLENRINTIDSALNTLCSRMSSKASFSVDDIILYCPISDYFGISRAIRESGTMIEIIPIVSTLTDPTLCLKGWFNWHAEKTYSQYKKVDINFIKSVSVYTGTATDTDQFQRIEYAS